MIRRRHAPGWRHGAGARASRPRGGNHQSPGRRQGRLVDGRPGARLRPFLTRHLPAAGITISNVYGGAGLAALQALGAGGADRRHTGLGRHPDPAGPHGGPCGRRPAAADHAAGGGAEGADRHRVTGRHPAWLRAGHRDPRGRRRRGRAARHAAARQPAASGRVAAPGAGWDEAQHRRLPLGRRGQAGCRQRQRRRGRAWPVQRDRRSA